MTRFLPGQEGACPGQYWPDMPGGRGAELNPAPLAQCDLAMITASATSPARKAQP